MKRQGSQLRKSLFYGLTLVLVFVFVYLAVQGNRMEKERLKQKADIVETVEATPIRALKPRDLESVPESMAKSPGPAENQPVARYRVRIRNSGSTTYSELNILLKFLDAHGSELGSFSKNVKQKTPPGNTPISLDIPADSVPAGTVGFSSSIVYADMGQEG
jgi:hypothetical protein